MTGDDWEVIGAALRERRPRYPHEAGLTCAALIALCALHYQDWVDLIMAGMGVAIAAYLTYRHWAAMKLWRRGQASFRTLTGRDP